MGNDHVLYVDVNMGQAVGYRKFSGDLPILQTAADSIFALRYVTGVRIYQTDGLPGDSSNRQRAREVYRKSKPQTGGACSGEAELEQDIRTILGGSLAIQLLETADKGPLHSSGRLRPPKL